MKAEVQDEGSIVLFRPLDEEAEDWLSINVNDDDAQWFGKSLCIDHRYADDLIQGFVNDGGEVS